MHRGKIIKLIDLLNELNELSGLCFNYVDCNAGKEYPILCKITGSFSDFDYNIGRDLSERIVGVIREYMSELEERITNMVLCEHKENKFNSVKDGE